MKINNKFKSVFSIFIAMVLLTALAITSTFFSVSASTDNVSAVLTGLQTAWKDIRKKSNKLNLFAYNDGTNTVFFENGINESTVNVELKKIITGGNTEVPLAGVDDFVMYYKLPAESKDTKVKVEAVLDSYKQILQRDSMEVTLTADGEWHEFKLSDMYKSSVNYPTWQSYWAKELGMSEYNDETRKICKLSFYTNGGNKIPAGSSFKSTVMITKENSYPTADTSDWTATDWYNAAMNIDVNDYYNTDDFAAARDKLGDVVDNNITLQELQTAWKDIRKKSNKLNLFAYNDGTNTVFFENGINESTVNVELKKIITGGNTEVPLAGVDDFVMYYKLPAESKDTKVKVEAVLDSYKQILQRDSMEVTLTADGEWHEFKLSDMYKDSATYPTWQSYWAKELGMSEYNDETRKICKLSFYTNGGNKIPAGSSFKSTVMITKENGYPTVDTSDWTAMDWYNAAMDIDVNDYYNTDDFAAARKSIAIYSAIEKIDVDTPDAMDLKNADDFLSEESNNVLSGYSRLNMVFEAKKNNIRLGDCNYDGKVDICDLVRMKKYLDGTDTDIFKYAAKMGKEEINAESLVALRIKLLAN